MTILLLNSRDHKEAWADALREKLPEHEVRVWPDVGDPAAVKHAVVCYPEHGALATLPNLTAMHSLWSDGPGSTMSPATRTCPGTCR